MRSVFLRDNRERMYGENELRFLIVLTLLIWAKFFMLDYIIADVLDWPTFGSFRHHVLRHASRALAVSVPSLGAILCFVVPFSLLGPGLRGRALVLLNFLLSLLALTDSLFIRYYTDVFVFRDIMLLPQTGLIAKSIWSLLKPYDLLLFIDIPVMLWFFHGDKLLVTFRPVAKKRLLVSVLILIISISVQGGAAWRLVQQRPNVVNAMYDRLSICAWVSVSSFHWGDVLSGVARIANAGEKPGALIAEIGDWFLAHYDPNPNPVAAGKNLIIIQSEALQQFVVGLTILGQEVTPNLNRFKNECLYFPNTWGQTAGGHSADAEFMTNTGLFPAANGVAYTLYADNDFNSLGRVLRARGYTNVAIQGTERAFWNCHRMYPQLGFHAQYSRNTYPNDEVIGLGLSDRAIFDRSLEIFDSLREPFYAFVVTLSSHHPFDFEGLDDGSFILPDELKDTLIGHYLIAIHYYDREFGRFIDALRANGMLEKSLVVVYGDHPAIPIAYQKELELLLNEPLHTPMTWRETKKIPLMFRVPGELQARGEDTADAGQMDVLPTISGLMGLEIKTVFGRDLLAGNKESPVIFRNGSYVTEGVYVEPGVKRASVLEVRQEIESAYYDQLTDEVERQLLYNDAILDKNLMENILIRLR